MNKIEFKVENKTQNTEYQAFYNKTKKLRNGKTYKYI